MLSSREGDGDEDKSRRRKIYAHMRRKFDFESRS
jgi:hypothetical protein